MNILSKTCQYAIRALIYISKNGSEVRKVGLKEVAEKLEIPAPFLAKVMQQLVRRRLVCSVKGPNGGFYLTDMGKKNTLFDVMEATDGLDSFAMCGLRMQECSPDNPCPIHYKIVQINDILKKTLASSTIHKMETQLHSSNFTIMR